MEQYVRRNLGAEVFERLIEPFCSGVYAGDPSKLSMKAAFGKVNFLRDHWHPMPSLLQVAQALTAGQALYRAWGLMAQAVALCFSAQLINFDVHEGLQHKIDRIATGTSPAQTRIEA